ncbi:yhgN [Wigglesworthia glossinidia endosymbiont of Glossina brevipalpis]|uniref:YhgN protein n=1 Tax=Wigglesworthia glossinidia brevipalpis TaxID=36870 RepID=Q8D2B2_WIGBR|nr:yhgN [Wigglesworthia glossinidia endosymbiont of Glossina brevipalpis]
MDKYLSNIILLFFIIDPLGNLPVILSMLSSFEAKKKRLIILREMLIALILMIIFLFYGEKVLFIFNIKMEIISISGGIILFLMSIKMIFKENENNVIKKEKKAPFIVPIAIPLLAGPGVFSTLIFLSDKNVNKSYEILLSLIIAWTFSLIIFLFSTIISNFFNEKRSNEIERLMGLILIMISVQMIFEGVKNYFLIN